MESFYLDSEGCLPVEGFFIDDSYPYLAEEVRFLKDIHRIMRAHPKPDVRIKLLTAWDYYMRRYPEVLAQLNAKSFDLKAISESHDWSSQLSVLEQKIEYFSSVGLKA